MVRAKSFSATAVLAALVIPQLSTPSSAETEAPEAIAVEARNYQRGQASVATGWGEPLSIGGQWAEYDLEIPRAGNYVLSVRYAAAESRPVSILLDGNLLTDRALASTTGSWLPSTGTWEEQAVVRLTARRHVLRFQREPCLPHITAFKLAWTTAAARVPLLERRKEILERVFSDARLALRPFRSTGEGKALSHQLARLEEDLARSDIGACTPPALQSFDDVEKRTQGLRTALAGLRTEALAGRRDKVVVWASTPLVKVFKDTLLPETASTKGVSMEACRNEYEPAQVCISSYDYRGQVRVKVPPLVHSSRKGRLPDASVRFVGYVPVPKNTQGHTDVLRKAPDMFPDPLILDGGVELAPRQTQPVWITVKVPKEALPGRYKGKVEVATAEGNTALPIGLQVYPKALPEQPVLWVGAWGGDTFLATALGLAGSDGKDYGPAYFSFLKEEAVRNRYEHRTRVFSDVPLWSVWSTSKVVWQDGRYSFDFTLFDEFVSTIEQGFEGRFRIICCGVAAGTSQDRKDLLSGDIVVHNPDGSVNREKGFSNVSTDNPEYRAFLASFFRAMEGHLRAKGWLGNIYFKVLDEVYGESLPASLRLSKHIKAAAPEIRLDETVVDPQMIREQHIDLPLVCTYLLPTQLQVVVEEIKKGREVWNYNNYRNMIDLPLMHTRIMGWANYLYGLRGYHHWAWAWKLDAWQNTYTDPFGAGEGFLVYLDKERRKIIDSLRWEMFRETVEDYDTLCLLEGAGGDGKAFCRELVRGVTDYETDPERFYQVRHHLLMKLNQR